MIEKIENYILELKSMKKYPKTLHKIGNFNLLKKLKISIVGTRKPLKYTKDYTYILSNKLSKNGVVVISGGALGVDSIAHHGAGFKNTIMILATGLKVKYPSINSKMIENIEKQGLVISQFYDNFKATTWSFVVRNELVVALGDILIVTEADINSGSMRSVEFAIEMKKKIYVLPHSLENSKGTNLLLEKGLAEPIYNIDKFINKFGEMNINENDNLDEFFIFCKKSPTLEEAVIKFQDRVYEEELNGNIVVRNGYLFLN